jgi:hypothetical protein
MERTIIVEKLFSEQSFYSFFSSLSPWIFKMEIREITPILESTHKRLNWSIFLDGLIEKPKSNHNKSFVYFSPQLL